MTVPSTPPTPAPQRSGMPKWLVILLVIGLIVGLGCCGGITACFYFARQAASSASTHLEQLAERARQEAEKQAAAAAARSGSETPEIPETPAEIPESFPKDIPIQKSLVASLVANDDASGGTTINFVGKDPATTIFHFYRTQMPKMGWTSAGSTDAAGSHSLSFTKEDRKAFIVITGAGNGANVMINHQPAK